MNSFLYRISKEIEPEEIITKVYPKHPAFYSKVENGCYMSRLEVAILCEAAQHYGGKFLEIGTNHGATAANICRFNPSVQVIGVDLPKGIGSTMHKNQMNEQPEKDQAGALALPFYNYQLIIANSRELIYQSGVSVVFIDGDHTYEGVKADTEKALRYAKHNKCLKMIIWHDYGNDQHPEYIGVDKYLDEEIATRFDLRKIAGTWLAFIEVNQ